jgi:hypothetical protein
VAKQPSPVEQALDAVQAAVQALTELGAVDDVEAERIATYSSRVERQLFFWRRSVEAAYLDRHGSVPHMVAAVALQEQVPQVQVLAQLITAGAVMPVWWKLDKYMTEHGVSLYPNELEKEADNGQNSGTG